MPSTTVGIVTQTVYSFSEIKCPPLKTPLNGKVSNNDLVVENIVTFICKSGYEVTGQPLLLCQESGTWNGTEPVCTGACLFLFGMSGMSVSGIAWPQPVIKDFSVEQCLSLMLKQRANFKKITVVLHVLSKNRANTIQRGILRNLHPCRTL